MMEKVTLNNKEQKRVIVLNKVLEGQMTGQEATEIEESPVKERLYFRRLDYQHAQHGSAPPYLLLFFVYLAFDLGRVK
jgi:hypothetical protein